MKCAKSTSPHSSTWNNGKMQVNLLKLQTTINQRKRTDQRKDLLLIVDFGVHQMDDVFAVSQTGQEVDLVQILIKCVLVCIMSRLKRRESSQ